MRELRTRAYGRECFGMVWMGTVEIKMLHTVGRFDVNACLKSIFLEPDIHINVSYVFAAEGLSEFDGKVAVEALQKFFQ